MSTNIVRSSWADDYSSDEDESSTEKMFVVKKPVIEEYEVVVSDGEVSNGTIPRNVEHAIRDIVNFLGDYSPTIVCFEGGLPINDSGKKTILSYNKDKKANGSAFNTVEAYAEQIAVESHQVKWKIFLQLLFKDKASQIGVYFDTKTISTKEKKSFSEIWNLKAGSFKKLAVISRKQSAPVISLTSPTKDSKQLAVKVVSFPIVRSKTVDDSSSYANVVTVDEPNQTSNDEAWRVHSAIEKSMEEEKESIKEKAEMAREKIIPFLKQLRTFMCCFQEGIEFKGKISQVSYVTTITGVRMYPSIDDLNAIQYHTDGIGIDVTEFLFDENQDAKFSFNFDTKTLFSFADGEPVPFCKALKHIVSDGVKKVNVAPSLLKVASSLFKVAPSLPEVAPSLSEVASIEVAPTEVVPAIFAEVTVASIPVVAEEYSELSNEELRKMVADLEAKKAKAEAEAEERKMLLAKLALLHAVPETL